MYRQQIIVSFLILSLISCNIFSDKGDVLFSKGKYTIAKKKLMSYYLASPDLYVKTERGEVKINLNPYAGKNRMAQEKISNVEIKEISNDSIQIDFISHDTLYRYPRQTIYINVKKAVDSITNK